MRQLVVALALFGIGALTSPAHARAHNMELHTVCSVDSDYELAVRDDGLQFTRDNGSPHDVFMHDGQLRVDGQPLAVSRDDAARLRQYEANVRALLPQVAAIARDGVGLGFDALATVAATFTDSPDERARVIRQLGDQRRQVLARIDQGIGHGRWQQHDFDQMMDEDMGDAVSTLVSTVASRAVKAALSGDQSQVAALEARAQSLESSIEKAVEAPAERLGKRADALCPRLVELDQLQHQLHVRLPDGEPLTLMSMQRTDEGAVAATRTP